MNFQNQDEVPNGRQSPAGKIQAHVTTDNGVSVGYYIWNITYYAERPSAHDILIFLTPRMLTILGEVKMDQHENSADIDDYDIYTDNADRTDRTDSPDQTNSIESRASESSRFPLDYGYSFLHKSRPPDDGRLRRQNAMCSLSATYVEYAESG